MIVVGREEMDTDNRMNPWTLVILGAITTIGAIVLEMPTVMIVAPGILTFIFLITAIRSQPRHSKYLDMLDIPSGHGSGHGANLIASMPPDEAVALLIEGITTHRSRRVRTRCLRLLVSYRLNDKALQSVREALKDKSAEVRHAAISFFGLRASQGQPVHAITEDLIKAITHPNDSVEENTGEEIFARMGIPMSASGALKLTVGARNIMMPYDQKRSDLVSAFKKELQRISSDDSEDPVLREDARKYLKYL